MYERILVPLDGSDLAEQVLPYVRTIAAGADVTVELVAVVEPIGELDYDEPQDYVGIVIGRSHQREVLTQMQEGIRQREAQRLDESAEDLGKGGIRATTKILEGDPAEAIISEADGHPGTLIAMATHTRSGIGRWLLGSVTDKVVRHANHPTFVVRAHEDSVAAAVPLKRVVLPLDGSATAEAAIPHAVEVAKALNIGIKMLHAVSFSSHATTDPDDYQELIELRQAAAHEYLNRVMDRIRAEGVPDVKEETFVGDAASSILDQLSESDDQLVVMATHGRSGVGRWMLGTVTDRVARHSRVPILVVRPGGQGGRTAEVPLRTGCPASRSSQSHFVFVSSPDAPFPKRNRPRPGRKERGTVTT